MQAESGVGRGGTLVPPLLGSSGTRCYSIRSRNPRPDAIATPFSDHTAGSVFRPATVTLGRIDGGAAGFTHTPFTLQPLDPTHIALRPVAAGLTRSHPYPPAPLVTATGPPVDPAKAQCLLDGGVVGESRHLATRFVQDEVDSWRCHVIGLEPLAPGGSVGQEQFGRLGFGHCAEP